MSRRPAGICVWILALALLVACASTGRNSPRLRPISASSSFRFASIGDNRGYADGTARPIFLKILDRLTEANPHLVINTGDLIDGYSSDEAVLRRQWRGYLAPLAPLKLPMFHAPGNHDIFDARSARLWREILGDPYYSFDYGPARFIVLDTETEEARVGARQLEWLRERLASAGSRHVFVALHRPLFPVDAAVGSSLDAHPAERDRLHALFVAHRASIKGVFQGHEHLYHFEERDGVPYHIVAGAGAELYAPPELGGFSHYLLVDVEAAGVSVSLHKLVAGPVRPVAAVPIARGDVLESWEDAAFWYTWDNTVAKQVARDRASHGRQGLEVWFDSSLSDQAVLYTLLTPSKDLREADSLAIDVLVPNDSGGRLRIATAVQGSERHFTPPVPLRAGWNTVVTDLAGAWLPPEERARARQVDWILTGDRDSDAAAGTAPRRRGGGPASVVFDNVRAEASLAPQREIQRDAIRLGSPRPAIARWNESWEQPLLWGAWDPGLTPEPDAALSTHGRQGLRVPYDFSLARRQILYAAPAPAWDLSGVEALIADVYASPGDRSGVRISLALGGRAGRYESAAQPLRAGWNRVHMSLDGWLPPAARPEVDRVEWVLSPAGPPARGSVAIDHFRAAP